MAVPVVLVCAAFAATVTVLAIVHEKLADPAYPALSVALIVTE
jgi:hypothetical protein